MRPLLVPAVSLLLALGACRSGGGNEPADVTTSTTHAYAPVVRACALGVPETRLTVEDHPDHIVVTFATVPERVAELRGRVAQQAAQNGPDRHVGPGHDGMHGTSHAHGLRLWDLPKVRAIVEETPDGARLHIAPLDASELGAVQAKLHERVRAIEDKDCP